MPDYSVFIITMSVRLQSVVDHVIPKLPDDVDVTIVPGTLPQLVTRWSEYLQREHNIAVEPARPQVGTRPCDITHVLTWLLARQRPERYAVIFEDDADVIVSKESFTRLLEAATRQMADSGWIYAKLTPTKATFDAPKEIPDHLLEVPLWPFQGNAMGISNMCYIIETEPFVRPWSDRERRTELGGILDGHLGAEFRVDPGPHGRTQLGHPPNVAGTLRHDIGRVIESANVGGSILDRGTQTLARGKVQLDVALGRLCWVTQSLKWNYMCETHTVFDHDGVLIENLGIDPPHPPQNFFDIEQTDRVALTYQFDDHPHPNERLIAMPWSQAKVFGPEIHVPMFIVDNQVQTNFLLQEMKGDHFWIELDLLRETPLSRIVLLWGNSYPQTVKIHTLGPNGWREFCSREKHDWRADIFGDVNLHATTVRLEMWPRPGKAFALIQVRLYTPDEPPRPPAARARWRAGELRMHSAPRRLRRTPDT